MTSLPSTQPIPHSKLKDKLRELVKLCFIKKNGQRRCKYLVLGRDRTYFVKKNLLILPKKFSETDIIKMLEFLIDNIFVMFGGRVFQQQTVGYLWIQTVIFFSLAFPLYSYEADFIQGLLKKNENKLARYFNLTFRYIDDILSLKKIFRTYKLWNFL